MVAYCSSTWLPRLSSAACAAADGGFGLRDLRLVIGGIDLDQEIAGLDALEVVDGDGEDLAGDPAAQPCQLGADIGVIGGLGRGVADPGIPAQRCHAIKMKATSTANSGIANRLHAPR